MDSLNVPVPGTVAGIAWDLRPALTGFEDLRDEFTLVVKRFEDERVGGRPIQDIAREALAGIDPFQVHLDGIGQFRDPPAGRAPVVYLALESPGLEAVHRRLVSRVGAVATLEGEAYVPHITLARGGPAEAVNGLGDAEIPDHTWTVDRLVWWDAATRRPVADLTLPI